MLNVFTLYRVPPDPTRAQAIQVVHSAHALARRGHHVWLLVDGDYTVWGAGPLETYGLSWVPSLKVIRLGRNPLGSLQYRAAFLRWLRFGPGKKVVIARSKRHAREALRWCSGRFHLVVEAHEVDSLLAVERGEEEQRCRALERDVFMGACGVLANAPGTAHLLQQTWQEGLPPVRVVHNATSADRVRQPTEDGHGYVVMGSALPGKDLATVARAAAVCSEPISLIGPRGALDGELTRLSEGRLRLCPPIGYHAVPDRLAEARAVILPLGDGLFGEHITSPLKLWDYLVCGRPVVAADTQAIRNIGVERIARYSVGSAEGLLHALSASQETSCPVPPYCRTWDVRAEEVEAFLTEVAP